ncbi:MULTISPECIES: hypothetical protein [Methylobacterium]|jgi:hypothetical protein|uniref:Uncharacterized protein n=1 Tax=Methylobacterium isbiliense TaxID=315478 RepID=A0ABQ4SRV3_9HYPH|nr:MULTISPECIES: hypothetical protein [Methylobacterium]MBY0297333.1 hypothetical protein [Methylobacterium sp.]MDN3625015.1 hypothetical protein [Methylobacterium isbiliense]GJE04553.1 hypothetical protein GMJLKIPL_6517 [Methylobacterium isbiliense]
MQVFRDDWATLFLRAVVSLFVGLPVGGILYALAWVAMAYASGDPATEHPWALAFRALGTAIGYVFMGGFAWSAEEGYRSLHGYYAAGVILSFVVMSRPWRRETPAPWPRAS